ncbi:MAG: hypothetical protein H6834_03415 [Planctomycetes bacterium]|nr:hypothetical protein [Planctomycetota bacterium]MCB9892535.1 hypothetical protein [Planctomycetota bacterium]
MKLHRAPRRLALPLLACFVWSSASCTVPTTDPDRATLQGLISQLDGKTRGELIDDFPSSMPGVDWARQELERHSRGRPDPSLLERVTRFDQTGATPGDAERAVDDAEAWFARRAAETAKVEAASVEAAKLDAARLESAKLESAKLAAAAKRVDDPQDRTAKVRADQLLEGTEASYRRLDAIERRLDGLSKRATNSDSDVTKADLVDLRRALEDATVRLDAMRNTAAQLPKDAAGAQRNAEQDESVVRSIAAQREALEAQQRALEAMQRRLDALFERLDENLRATKVAPEDKARFEQFEKRLHEEIGSLATRLEQNDRARNDEVTLLRRELGDAVTGFVAASRTSNEGDRVQKLLPSFANDLAAIRRRLAQSETRAESVRDELTSGVDTLRKLLSDRPTGVAPTRIGDDLAERIDSLAKAITDKEGRRTLELEALSKTLDERDAAIAKERKAASDAVAAFEKRFDAALKTLESEFEKSSSDRKSDLTDLRAEIKSLASANTTGNASEGVARTAPPMTTANADLLAIKNRLEASENLAAAGRRSMLESLEDLRSSLASRPPSPSDANAVGTRLEARLAVIADEMQKRDTALRAELAEFRTRIAETEKAEAARLVASVKAEKEASDKMLARLDELRAAFGKVRAAPVDAETARTLAELGERFSATSKRLEDAARGIEAAAKAASESAPSPAAGPRIDAGTAGELAKLRATLEALDARAGKNREEIDSRLTALNELLAEAKSVAATGERAAAEAAAAKAVAEFETRFGSRFASLDAKLAASSDKRDRELSALRRELGDAVAGFAVAAKSGDGKATVAIPGFTAELEAIRERLTASDKSAAASRDELAKGVAALRAELTGTERSASIAKTEAKLASRLDDLVARLDEQDARVAREIAGLRTAVKESEASASKLEAQRQQALLARVDALKTDVFAGFDERQKALEAKLTGDASASALSKQFDAMRADFVRRFDGQRTELAKSLAGIAAAAGGSDTATAAMEAKRAEDLTRRFDSLRDEVFAKLDERQKALEARIVETSRQLDVQKQLDALRTDLNARLDKDAARLSNEAKAADEARVAELRKQLSELEKGALARIESAITKNAAANSSTTSEVTKSILERLQTLRGEVFAKLDERQKALEAKLADDPRSADLAKQLTELRADLGKRFENQAAELAQADEAAAKRLETERAALIRDLRTELSQLTAKSEDASKGLSTKLDAFRTEVFGKIDARQKELEAKISNDPKTLEIGNSVAALRTELDKQLEAQSQLITKRLDSLDAKRVADFDKRLEAFEASVSKGEKVVADRFSALQTEVAKNLDAQRDVFEKLWKERSVAMAEEKQRELAREDALSRRLTEIEKSMKQRFDLQQQTLATKLEEVGDPGPIIVERFEKLHTQSVELAKSLETVQKEISALGASNPSAAVASLDSRVAAMQTDLAKRFEAQRVDFAERLANAVQPSDQMRSRVDTLIEQSVALTRRLDAMNARIAEMQVSKATGSGGIAGAEAVKSALAPLTTGLRDEVMSRLSEQNKAFESVLAEQRKSFEDKLDRQRVAILDAVAKGAGSAGPASFDKQLEAIDKRLDAERRAFSEALDKSQERVTQALQSRLDELLKSPSTGGNVPAIAREIEDLRTGLEKAELERARNRKDVILRLDALGSSLSTLRSRMASTSPLFTEAASDASGSNKTSSGASNAERRSEDDAAKTSGARTTENTTENPKPVFATGENEGGATRRDATRISDAADRARSDAQVPPNPLGEAGGDGLMQWLPWGLGILALFLMIFLLFRGEGKAAVPATAGTGSNGGSATIVSRHAVTKSVPSRQSRAASRSHEPATKPSDRADVKKPFEAKRIEPDSLPRGSEVVLTPEPKKPSVDEARDLALDAFTLEASDFDPRSLDPAAFDLPSSDVQAGRPNAPKLSVSSLASGIAGGPRVQSLRLGEKEISPGADKAVTRFLGRERRVLVEPAPHVEARSDGSLSIRFYVAGDLDPKDIADLVEGCRKHAR